MCSTSRDVEEIRGFDEFGVSALPDILHLLLPMRCDAHLSEPTIRTQSEGLLPVDASAKSAMEEPRLKETA